MMKQGEPTRAVGYVRVSTDEQVQGFSLEGQVERIQPLQCHALLVRVPVE